MLELKSINKSYQTGNFRQEALHNLDLSFRQNEFVAVLGHSGSGKTTLLNIIGGLDRYDSGDLIINGKSTKKFKNKDWDAYRNNCIGFIFQSYNLITHTSVLKNVELGMTLSGVKNKIKRKRAMEALDKVGIKDHAHKKPNQLSGGQMQRVAIARALVNNPDIVLADEPTGALDSKTSVQIMELIKEIAKDKLVIMVTHNRELAEKYANRVVELKDGEKVKDSNPVDDKEAKKEFKIKKTAMSFITALNLSLNNIFTKKGRTLLTALASSIGIIGIALILSLSNGFDIQIKNFERESLSQLPIMISQTAMQMDHDEMHEMMGPQEATFPDTKVIYPRVSMQEQITHTNRLTDEFLDYLRNIDESWIAAMSFQPMTNLNIITRNKEGIYVPAGNVFGAIPSRFSGENRFEFMENTFDVLYGTFPETKEDLVLIVGHNNEVTTDILDALGFDSTMESISFSDVVGREFKLINNDDFYVSFGNRFMPNNDFERLYNNREVTTLRISGIVRGKEGKEMITSFSSGVGYTQELIDYIVSVNKDSRIVRAQGEADFNVLSGEPIPSSEEGRSAKDNILAFLGAESAPVFIQIFARDFETKDKVVAYLDEFNEGKEQEDKVIYNDMGRMIADLSSNIMNGITIVLVAFSSISLIVSSIMIAIITYISVLERTKEIGILRALGARKKDITRVFNAETFIIGLTSGMLGIFIASLLIIPANIILYNLTDLENVAVLSPIHALVLIIISLVLTLIGGFIPAKMASKKDPVEALRTE